MSKLSLILQCASNRPSANTHLFQPNFRCVFQNAPNYERWQKTYAPNAPRLYVAANFFNITNLDEVRKGALPIVEEVGPYVYWCAHMHTNGHA